MYYSQCEQDKYLDMNVFKGFKNGVFMDIGAHDGVDLSNTLYFEKEHGWTGVHVEPNEVIFKRLVQNRPNCININCAVSNKEGISDFYLNTGYTEMISGLKDNFDPRHLARLERENKEKGSSTEVVKVQTKRVDTICDENNIKYIHYLSIDVEGAEFDVIKSIDFDKVYIDLIGFENNFDDASQPIVEYLYTKGYIILRVYTDIFMIHYQSRFLSSM
jgi:FkbM family methyltransferase